MAQEFRLPELGENVESGTVARLLVAQGDTIAVNQAVVEIETGKAVAEIPCPYGGTISEFRVQEGQTVKPGDVILVLDAGVSAPAAPRPEKAAPEVLPEAAIAAAQAQAPKAAAQPTPAPALSPAPSSAPAVGVPSGSPSARRRARETGVGGEPVTPPGTASSAASASTPQPGTETHEPMSAIRKMTAQHMAHSWQTIAHVTHFEKADITELEALRAQYAKQAQQAGVKLTAIAFVIKALTEALKRFPKFNASIDMENQQIVLKSFYHIGVAVDTPHGLLVPVLRDADRKSVLDIARELPILAENARARKLAVEEMQGGTFTVTNLGGIGGTSFTPIINAPEAAILGMSRNAIEPVWRDGQFVPRTLLPLSLSYDHRMIDGAEAARFSRWLCAALEQPWTMFLGL